MKRAAESAALHSMRKRDLERRIEERTELLRARRMGQLAERLRLDLANPFARHIERAADFFERVLGAVADAEAHLEDLLLARGERAQDFVRLLFQVRDDHVIDRGDHAAIFDEVAEMRIFLFADRRLEGDRLLRDLHDLAHFGDRHIHPLGDLLGLRFAAEFLHERTRGARELVDGLDHVHRDADGAGLIGDGASDGLANPPRRVRGELVAAAVFEFLNGLHQADVAFLDEVEELQAAVRVLLGDRDYEAEVGDDQFLLGLIGFLFAGANLADRASQFIVLRAVKRIQLLQLVGVLLQTAAIEIAAGLVLLALDGRVILADHRRRLCQLVIDVLQLVDHPIARLRREVDLAQFGGELHRQFFDGALRLFERPLGKFLRIEQLRFRVFDFFVVLRHLLEDHHDVGDLVDGGERELRLAVVVGGHVDRFVFRHRQIDHLFDDARILLGALVDLQDLFENDPVLRQRLVDAALPFFDAFGDVHFALAVEELDRAHLAQVHAHGIVGLVDDAAVGLDDVLLDFFALVHLLLFDGAVDGDDGFGRGGGKRLLGILDDVDAEVCEADVDLIELLRQRGNFLGEGFVDLVVKQEALFFPYNDELLYFRVFFFDTQLADPLVKIGFLFEIRAPQACRHVVLSLLRTIVRRGHQRNRWGTIIISLRSTYGTRASSQRQALRRGLRLPGAARPRCPVEFPDSGVRDTHVP